MQPENTLTIRVPEALKQRLETLAAQQGISVNQFATYALTREIGEWATGRVFRGLVKGVEKKSMFKELDEILANVPDREAPEWDRMA